jgi:hypothetical protein
LNRKEDDMAQIEVSCKVSCQKCGWSTGATILTDEPNVLEEVLAFIKGCWHQHSSSTLAGDMSVVWQPLESAPH